MYASQHAYVHWFICLISHVDGDYARVRIIGTDSYISINA